MYYGKTFYNKELAEMIYEYLHDIFGAKCILEHINGEYCVRVNDPDLRLLTDLQREMVKFLMPHIK